MLEMQPEPIPSDQGSEDIGNAYRHKSETAHKAAFQGLSEATRDDESFCSGLARMIRNGYYKRFVEWVHKSVVEHPNLESYIVCDKPRHGLNSTVEIVGARVKLHPKYGYVYEMLAARLKQESGIDLDRRIREATVRAEDAAAVKDPPPEWGAVGKGRPKDRVDNINSKAEGGTSRSYIVGRLRREAAKVEEADPLFVEPEAAKAAELLNRVLSQEMSAHAAGIEMGWRQKTISIPADIHGAAKAIRRQFTRDQLAQLVALIQKSD